MDTTKKRLSQKITAIAESATLKVDAKAKALKAEGRPIISYAAGEPDFVTPAHIVTAARAALDDPANFRYTAAAGLPELREAIAGKTRVTTGIDYPISQIIVTNGGKQAVYEAFQILCDVGDEIIVPGPFWTTYPEAIALADGVAVPVYAGADQDYKVTVSQLESARTEKTKALVFCSPSNPTGAVYSAAETEAIGKWAHEHGIWVITDEIYQDLTYDGVSATSILKAVPELAEQALIVSGVAKSYAMTGWRLGWIIGPADVMKGCANLQSHLASNVNNIAQRAAIAALTGPVEPILEMREAFNRRRKLIVSELNKVQGFNCPTPEGAFYAYVDVSGALGLEINGKIANSSLELADIILSDAEVAAVPGEAFGPSGYLRFSYALGDKALLEGVQRIQNLLGTK